ncbi:MAG: pseudouridine synthase [Dehalococcoidia bacterium]|nr:pseudouridine synthase [Dehalococcoidia bacterium]
MSTPSPAPPSGERLQKLLARAGFGSRRGAEALIEAGRVTVDGRVATLGTRADPATTRIEVDGTPIALEAGETTLVLHKPRGYVVTRVDEQGRPTVFDLLTGAPSHLRYVGRLDQESEGLLLLTTDGELAHRLTHPRYGIEKVYEATIEGTPLAATLQTLRRGVPLEDGPTAPARVTVLGTEPGPGGRVRSVVRVGIHEGRNRQVRRMFDAVGHRVLRLVRTEVGPVRLEGLPRGGSRAVDDRELAALRQAVGLG